MRWFVGIIAGILLLVGLYFGTLSNRPALGMQATTQNEAELLPGAYLTEYAVESTLLPKRDNYAVYSRLRAPVTSTVRTTTKRVYKVGDQETFTVFDLEKKQPYKVNAVAVAVTPHLYMFADVNSRQDRAQLARVAQQFEDKVYPTTRQFFGSEASPGVDNDPRVVVLNTPLKLAVGYYSSDDGLLRTVNPNSNEREMFYIGADPASESSYLSVLAHEFQHMIHNNNLPHQDLWLNEGQSVLAQVLNGYSSAGYEIAYMGRPATQLGTWACSTCNTARYYGAGYVFLSHIQDRYGFEAVRDIATNGKALTGMASVDFAMYQNVPGADHLTVFKGFVAANYLNGRTQDPNYTYKNIRSRVEPSTPLGVNRPREDSVPQYGANYYLVPDKNEEGFTLNFKGDATVKLAGPGAKSGQNAWWTNRGDDMNTTLTRDVDLTGVRTATFRFSTWFDIEPSYDWVYVEVSEDDGKTWQIVPGRKYTSTNNPTGKSYGAGITGQGTAAKLELDDTEQVRSEWVQDSFDLSKWAGKKIKLRLEYLTDEGYNRQGALFDDFEIPEIGWKDDAENGEAGWVADGFIRSNVTLPQRFSVQVIRRDGSCGDVNVTDLSKANDGQSCIVEMKLDDLNNGSQKFPFKQAVVVVAPYATKTLNPASYTIEVR
jgi:immune inhibitor A